MDNPEFRIEDNILKGKAVPFSSKYTSLGEFVLDSLEARPDFVGEYNVDTMAFKVDTRTGETYTYEKMRDRSIRCARWMKSQGLVAGDVVTICSYNHLDVAMPCFAAMFIGAIVNPLDAGWSKRELQHLLSITEPKVAFVGEAVAQIIADAASDAKLDLKIIVFGKATGFLDFESIIALPNVSQETNFELTPIDDPQVTAFILCTSGTTGSPKGVSLCHEVFLKQLGWATDLVESNSIWAIFTSVSWITGTFYIFSSLCLGNPRLIVPNFEEYSACELIERFKVKWVFMAPNMINRLLKSDAVNKYDISCLEQICCGGSTLSDASQKAFAKIIPHARLMVGYGCTEAGGVISGLTIASKPGSSGRIWPNCQLKVIDPDTGRILGPNQKGELLLKSNTMMNCYYRNPQATAQTVDEEGWIHSGDLGYYDEDGEIFVVDRLKELIKYRGYHISPCDIENLILTHSDVQDVAVVGLPHPQDDEHPLAFVVSTGNSVSTDKKVIEKELMDLVAAEMSDSKRLRGGVKFIENIPRTASGKIQRRILLNSAISMTTSSKYR